MKTVNEIHEEMVAAFWLSGVDGAMNVYNAIEDFRMQVAVSHAIEHEAFEGTVEEKIFDELCSR